MNNNKLITQLVFIFLALLIASMLQIVLSPPSSLSIKIISPASNSVFTGAIPLIVDIRPASEATFNVMVGAGNNPHVWNLITSNRFQATASDIEQSRVNLGFWNTADTDDHGAKTQRIKGLYSLRVRGCNEIQCTQDITLVHIAQQINNSIGGKLSNVESECKLTILPQSISAATLIGEINSFSRIPISLPKGYRSASNYYQLIPSGQIFLNPARLEISVPYRIRQNPVIAYYKTSQKSWMILPSQWNLSTRIVETNIEVIPTSDLSFFTVLIPRRSLRSKNQRIVDSASITSSANFILISNVPLSLKKTPTLIIQYRLRKEHTLALYLLTSGKSFEVNLGDDPHFNWQLNKKIPGFIPILNPNAQIIKDNEWHTLTLNIANELERYTGNTTIQQIVAANWDNEDYMEWKIGKSFTKPYSIKLKWSNQTSTKNISESSSIWDIGYWDNASTEFGSTKQTRYQIGHDYSYFPRTLTQTSPQIQIDFSLSKTKLDQLSRKPYLLINLADYDTTTPTNTVFSVELNQQPQGKFRVPLDGTRFLIDIKDDLVIGDNHLVLKRDTGGQWIQWDYIGLQMFDEPTVPNGFYLFLGKEDKSAEEFTHELNVGNDFFVGQPIEIMKKAISFKRPKLNIYFHLPTSANNQKNFEFIIGKANTTGSIMDPRYSTTLRIQVNNRRPQKLTYKAYAQRLILPITGLTEGPNKISLKWLSGKSGGEVFDFDYLALQ